MGSSSWHGAGGAAEPDLSWMSFSPEAHGIKPALSVWSSRNNNHFTSDEQQQQQQRLENDDEGSRRNPWGRANSRSNFGEAEGPGSEYEWREEETMEENEEEAGLRRRRRGQRRDTGKEQARKINKDFGHDNDGDSCLSSPGLSVGIQRPAPYSPRFLGHGFKSRGQSKSGMEVLDEDAITAAQLPWNSKFPGLQFAATVTFVGCLVALVTTIFLLYLSFGMSAQPPSSCEVEKVVLSFTARRIRLRGGRYISFREEGVGADRAKQSLLVVHDLLSSRLAGIPGIRESLLNEFGVRLIAYDRPGYGQSDPHPGRSYNSSAQDMADIADALGVMGRFWVAGFGSGGPHVWAAIKYIPERLAGVALFAPAGSFYADNMTKEEVAGTWGLLNLRQKWMYSIARLFPALLPSLLQKTLVDHNPSPLRTLGGHSVGSKDQVLMENENILNFWKRDAREALQQQCAFPIVEELILLVNNWGFSLAKLYFHERDVKNLWQQLVGLFHVKEKPRMFSGPIHIWQGTADQYVPATINEYARRMILLNDFSEITDSPVNLHVLEGEGHFSWFWFCDECHRTIFKSLFQPEDAVAGPYGPQVFSAEEYEAILAAFGGAKEIVSKLKKSEEAPVPFTRIVEEAVDDPLYRNAHPEEDISTGIKLYVSDSCDVPTDLSTFIIRAIDERFRKYIR